MQIKDRERNKMLNRQMKRKRGKKRKIMKDKQIEHD